MQIKPMTEEQKKEWDETKDWEKRYPNNPKVMLAIIETRQRILKEMGAVS